MELDFMESYPFRKTTCPSGLTQIDPSMKDQEDRPNKDPVPTHLQAPIYTDLRVELENNPWDLRAPKAKKEIDRLRRGPSYPQLSLF